MTGAYLFHGRDGSTYYAIVWFNGYINMVRFITSGGLDTMRNKSGGFSYPGVISFAVAARFGLFMWMVPGPERNAGLGRSERGEWLSALEKPRRSAICSGHKRDNDNRNGARNTRLDPLLCCLLEFGGRERAVEHGDKYNRHAAADKPAARNGARSPVIAPRESCDSA